VIASAHLAAGVVIGMASTRFLRWRPGRVVVAFATGVILHLAMDHVPHADYNDLGGWLLIAIVFLESFIALTIMYFIARDRVSPGWFPSIVAGVTGSALPDVKFFAPFMLPAEYAAVASDWGEQLHYAIHAPPTSFGVGMVTQLTAVCLLLAVLMAFPRTKAR
jgi:hypothetical protein